MVSFFLVGSLTWWILGYIAYKKASFLDLVYLWKLCVWIVALVHALLLSPDQAKTQERQLTSGTVQLCPYCAEMIQPRAIVCGFCGHGLPN